MKSASSKYYCSYIVSNLKKNPFLVCGKYKYVIKGGFWDGRVELNPLNIEQNNQTHPSRLI